MSDQHDSDSVGYLTGHLRHTKAGLGYSRSSYAAKTYRTYGDFLPRDRMARVLEVGPGECEFAEMLRTRYLFTNVEIVDTSSEVGAFAERLGIRATVTADTMSFLSDRRDTFDAVLMFHVLEHVPKPQVVPLLRSVRESLVHGGTLLLEVPNMGDPLNGLYYRYADFTHEVGFTEESVRYVLGQAGFGSTDFLPQLGASSRPGRLAQGVSRGALHGLLYMLNLPNGRQMRRRIGPVLAVRATA